MSTNCQHGVGYQRILQTDNFIIAIIRCRMCDEFLKAETKAKEKQSEIQNTQPNS